MKPEMVTLKVGEATIKLPASAVASLALASIVAQITPQAVQPAVNSPLIVPALGEVWPGQGGFNGGLVAARGDVPAHYLIVAKDDAGKHKWGGYEKESDATSKTDGVANTAALIEEGSHAAAEMANAYQAEGHADFCLPACAELYQCWVNVPELFQKDWYWSSSQRSAYNAFYQNFDDGNQDGSGKGSEFRVRPVRRLFI